MTTSEVRDLPAVRGVQDQDPVAPVVTVVVPSVAVDVLLGAVSLAAGAARTVATPLAAATGLGVAGWRRLSRRRLPDRVLAGLEERGGHVRHDLQALAAKLLPEVVCQVADAVLGALDLTALVHRHVDLDAVVSRVDVDGIVARADVDAVASRLDLDAVLSRIDVDEVARRLDVDAVVARVDLDAVLARIDLDEVAKRLDADAVVARVDLDAVLARLDLPAIAMRVITAIDLPEIVRESTGPAASEVVRGIRAEGAQADDAVARLVDRLLHRTRREPAGNRVTTPAGRAGVVSRTIAAVVDSAIVAGSTVLVYLALVAARFAWSPLDFTWPTPSGPRSGAVFVGMAIVYLTAAWARTGRTQGANLLGLRVVSARLGPLGWGRAAVRAVAYVVFPLGLLWSAVSSTRRSLQDMLVGSVVVYDWHRDGGARLAEAQVRPETAGGLPPRHSV